MGQSLACCTSRDNGNDHENRHIHVHLEFFDCVETEEERRELIKGDEDVSLPLPFCRRGTLRSFDLLDVIDDRSSNSRGLHNTCVGHSRECGDGVEVALEALQDGVQRRCRHVTQQVRDMWKRRIADNERMSEALAELLQSGFPELDEWTTPSSVLRMLGAQDNDVNISIEVLMQAIELRILGRNLYKEMKCSVHCDMHVVARDKLNRPTIYICAGSQVDPLLYLKDQILLCFEAAVNLCDDKNGQFTLVMDMRGFSARLNANPMSIRVLSDHLGTIYADRLAKIIVVDFSAVIQGIWMLVKPLLREKTRKKIAFVSRRKAEAMISEDWDADNHAKICDAFEINRSGSSTASERLAHAERASICDVPLRTSRKTFVE